MAENVLITPGTGDTIAADDISSVKYQRVKLVLGADGVNDGDVASENPVPITGTVTANPASGTIDTVSAVTAITNALPAGTNAIGKLAANSGVDIGDVDVLSSALPTGAATSALQSLGAVVGSADPTIDSYTQAAISAVTGADQSLVAAPGASKQIWVYGINFTMTTAGTVAFQDEDDTAITGAMAIEDKGGMAVAPSGNFAMPLWKVATNKALEADVVTGTINGSISYAVVSV